MPRTTPTQPDNLEEVPPGWCRKYVGTRYMPPYGCFFLVAEVLQAEFDVKGVPIVEDFTQVSEGTLRAHASAIAVGLQGNCREIAPGDTQVGDVIAIGTRERMYHIGILVAKNWMLHSHEGADACLERLNSLKWKGRIAGYYRPIGR